MFLIGSHLYFLIPGLLVLISLTTLYTAAAGTPNSRIGNEAPDIKHTTKIIFNYDVTNYDNCKLLRSKVQSPSVGHAVRLVKTAKTIRTVRMLGTL